MLGADATQFSLGSDGFLTGEPSFSDPPVPSTVTGDVAVNSGFVGNFFGFGFGSAGVTSLIIEGDVDVAGGFFGGNVDVEGDVNVAGGVVSGPVIISGHLDFNDPLTGTFQPSSSFLFDPFAEPSDSVASSGSLTLGSNDVFQVQINPDGPDSFASSQLVVTDGPVNIAGSQLSLSTNGTIPTGQVNVIIDNQGAGAVGPFAGLDEGDVITTSDGQRFQISYVGGVDNNDVTLTTLAPPSSVRFEFTQSPSSGAIITEGDTAAIEYTISLVDPANTANTANPAVLNPGEDAFVRVSFNPFSTINALTDGVDTQERLLEALDDAVDGIPGVSFDLESNLLTFTAGDSPTSFAPIDFSITSVEDNLVEASEGINVFLLEDGSDTGVNTSLSISGSGQPLQAAIDDNDEAQFVISSSLVEEGEEIEFTIELVNPATGMAAEFGAGVGARVDISLANGSAEEGEDFDNVFFTNFMSAAVATTGVSASQSSQTGVGQLNFSATEDGDTLTPITFTVPTVVDSLIEGDEKLYCLAFKSW